MCVDSRLAIAKTYRNARPYRPKESESGLSIFDRAGFDSLQGA